MLCLVVVPHIFIMFQWVTDFMNLIVNFRMPAPPTFPDASASHSLWQSLVSLRQMDMAWEKVRANNGCAGGDNLTIDMFQPGAARRLSDLANDLKCGAYQPSPYRVIDISKKKGGHRRLLIPSLVDRVALTALAQILGPVLEPQFEDSSFAYRPGRSVKQAVQAIERWRNAGFWHVIEADIVGFFDAIQHDLLLTKLEAALDGLPGAVEIVDLIAMMLEHQSLQTGIMGRGVAQGSPLSPLLANLYLDALDEAMAEKGVRLVRFADDFVILCKKRHDAQRALDEAESALQEHGLALHEDGTRIVDFDRGFEFLGHLFVRSFAFQQVSDPMEDPVQLLRGIAHEDAVDARVAEAEEVQAKAGYDRGARVLYVTEPGRRVALRNLSFTIETVEGRELAAISHNRVDRIEVGPRAHIEANVFEHCLATETDLAIVDGFGALRGALVKPDTDSAELHLKQAALALSPDQSAIVARSLVDARIRNQRTQLFRLNRTKENGDVTAALTRMGRHLRKLDRMETVDQLRGLEGVVAAEYWPALGLLTRDAPSPLRRSRPADDAMNAAINYLTAILLRDVRAGVLASGLHPGFGSLHASRDRADAVVYDLMEPFRAPLTEGLVSYLFNARRLRAEMFRPLPEGGVRIGRDARTALIKGYEQGVAKRVKVTGRSIKLAWRPLMLRQAQDLAKALRNNDLSRFQPYLMEA